ncbi:hypothetical protein SK128_027630, partial [Halocaridina rubra]
MAVNIKTENENIANDSASNNFLASQEEENFSGIATPVDENDTDSLESRKDNEEADQNVNEGSKTLVGTKDRPHVCTVC